MNETQPAPDLATQPPMKLEARVAAKLEVQLNTMPNTARWSKILLLAATGFFFLLVVFNNTTDFDSNYQFVRHILSMDTTFPNNRGLWRAIPSPFLHHLFYLGIIAWEALNAILSFWASLALFRTRHASAPVFAQAKSLGTAALTAGMLLWFVAFLSIGGEWFLMWQSPTWNGQEAAFRMFLSEAAILIYLHLPEPTLPE